MIYKLSKYSIKISQDENTVILYNTFSGSIVRLENVIYQELLGEKIQCSEKIHYDLIRQGFLVPNCQNEFFKAKYIMHSKLQSDQVDSLSYVIAPTMKCNMNCVYCFEANSDKEVVMTTETADKVIQFIVKTIKNKKSIKKLKICWFGGEPMLCYDLILNISERLLCLLKPLGIEYNASMISNGLLLTRERAEKLVTDARINRVQITLDGFSETYAMRKRTDKNNFYIVVNNIKEIADLLTVTIRLNADKKNLHELYKLAYYLLKGLGLKGKIKISLSNIRDYIDNLCGNCYFVDEFSLVKKRFYNKLSQESLYPKQSVERPPFFQPVFCGMAKKNNFVIGPSGELYKCEHYIGLGNKVIGSIFDGLYYNDAQKQSAMGNMNLGCQTCDLYPACQCECFGIYDCSVKNGNCLIYNALLAKIKNQVLEYISKGKKYTS